MRLGQQDLVLRIVYFVSAMKSTVLLTAALFISFAMAANAQNNMVFETPDPKEDSVFVSRMDAFDHARIGRPFALKSVVETVDGKRFDFGNLRGTTVVCFGFFGCHPCMRELPFFVQASKEHPETDFIYITFDAEKERKREFDEAGLKDFKSPSNYYIVHMDRTEISRLQLTMGYPTRYILNKDGVVVRMKYPYTPEGGELMKRRIEEFITVR